jgi:hypothetical protein
VVESEDYTNKRLECTCLKMLDSQY